MKKNKENNTMKDYYKKNQEYFDKAVLAIILAMPPFLTFIFKNIAPNKPELNIIFLSVLALSFLVIAFYLISFILARNGCNNIDYADSLEDKEKANDFLQNEINKINKKGLLQVKLADWLEYLYLLLIILIFIGIFIGFAMI